MAIAITKQEFLERCKKVHGDTYDYSELEYTKLNTKGKIICKKHGPFFQYLVSHIQAARGCPECAGMKKHTIETFIKKAVSIHGDKYDYSNVNYLNNKTHVLVRCISCDETFRVRPDAHFNGRGCIKCGYQRSSEKRRTTKERFVELATRYHGDRYDYTDSIYTGMSDTINIVCKDHGEFNQLVSNHITGAGCPLCTASKGEDTITKFLVSNDIKFEIEKTFEGCKNPETGRVMFFDFYLPEHNIIIEYDGAQHYSANEFFGGLESLISLKYRDSIKTRYCIDHNINIVRIIYLDDDKIPFILKTILNV